MMRKKMLAVGTWLLALIMPVRADDSLICGDTTFDVEQGFVGGAVTAVTAAGTSQFCVSENPAVLTKRLSFHDQEVWCVTLHHLSSDSRPLAKQLWVLNRLSKKLYHYDYLFADGVWHLQDERHEICKIAQLNSSVN